MTPKSLSSGPYAHPGKLTHTKQTFFKKKEKRDIDLSHLCSNWDKKTDEAAVQIIAHNLAQTLLFIETLGINYRHGITLAFENTRLKSSVCPQDSPFQMFADRAVLRNKLGINQAILPRNISR